MYFKTMLSFLMSLLRAMHCILWNNLCDISHLLLKIMEVLLVILQRGGATRAGLLSFS